ncbi:hypothetical protein [Guptibacillus algicola]|uniref:hypothetical protein n=1 Tax=Guptibacillus algicola TaxID=225844 RepID=UPI001CD730F5|nr:hypothetical protein [Alkalihalobacillus algicola]MCA0986400.1 hypothetical protein [Alkalihalobacillus algicola]
MMKKGIFALILALLVAFPFAGTAVHAEANVSDKVEKGVASYIGEEHYDYDKGSLSIKESDSFEVSSSADKEFSQVTMMVVDFQTVRDNIFFEDHTQVIFYDTEANAVIPDTKVLDLEQAKEFKDSHAEETGSHLHMGVVLFLHALMIIVPALIVLVFIKGWYSTLGFKLQNNVYDTNTTF